MYSSPTTKVSSLTYFKNSWNKNPVCVQLNSWSYFLVHFQLPSKFFIPGTGAGLWSQSLPLSLDNSVTLCRWFLLLLHHWPHLLNGYLSSRVLEKITLGNACKSFRKYCLNCLINAKCCYCPKNAFHVYLCLQFSAVSGY